jgi:hypothetical protein
MEAFNSGLEPHDPEHARLLRQEYALWLEATEKRKADPLAQDRWIKLVLGRTLELDEHVLLEGQAIPQTLQAEKREYNELLRPSIVLADPNTQNPRMLIQVYPKSQDLTSYVTGSIWKASPDTRMTELLHATGVRLGLVTNGEHWMLVDAPKQESTGYASWYAALWIEEPITLRAFRSLLGASRFFNVSDEQTLESLFAKSASNQQEVTYQLGYQVRRAVEVLIASLNRADQDFGRQLLGDITESKLYESALTVMMRLVFLFCAEERELIPSKPFPVYDQNYSVSSISRQLRELADQHGEELLERRYDAWLRLLSAFRIVHGGLTHDDLSIPAYGGSLFDPDRYPFLEGRAAKTTWRSTDANPLPVNNRTVLHLLEALQYLETNVPGSKEKTLRRVSFRALDILQIGHVYEGLLDHTAKKAAEPFLGIVGTRDNEPEIPLAKLEEQLAKGEDTLAGFLKDRTGKSVSALNKAFKTELDAQLAARFRTACQGDDSLWKRVEPFAGLVRSDSFGYPCVITEKSFFVTSGTDRRSSGTHYTPRILTEPIVKHTLDPLVYVGPAEGLPENQWKLKSAKEILALKVCDMACGSGAFLVEACRYLAARLMEAWAIERASEPESVRTTPEAGESKGNVAESIIPDDPREQEIYAMRLVAQRCLYGVDINPLAVEMAKLSLWLLTMSKDKPFEFLDHSIRCGDSLVGLSNLDQLRYFSLKPVPENEVLFRGPLDGAISDAIDLRLKLEDMPCNTVEDVQRQEKLLEEANQKIAKLRCAADMLVAAVFWGENARDKLAKTQYASRKSVDLFEADAIQEFEELAAKERRGQKMFHWPLEFPEVMVKRGGFDAFVGNPPFVGGKRITGSLGFAFRDYVVEAVANGERGNADLCSYFFLRCAALALSGGQFGLLATNSIAQGETREVGIAQLTSSDFSIPRAVQSRKWPGTANLEVSHVWIHCGQWNGAYYLDDNEVEGITSYLNPVGQVLGKPHQLASNDKLAFQGSNLRGIGFVLSPDEANALIAADGRNRDILFPYLNGQDLNTNPDQSPSRWVINFFDWDRKRASQYSTVFKIVEERVLPERQKIKHAGTRKRGMDFFWRYDSQGKDLYETIANHEQVLVTAEVSKYVSFAFEKNNMVFSHMLIVFPFTRFSQFSLLQSAIHEVWAREHGSTLETRFRYTPKECLATYPIPRSAPAALEGIGESYYRHRKKLMTASDTGLTKTYNRFHDSNDTSADIQKLRDLHVEMDNAVATAYGWADLDLNHGFRETKQGIRFTISEPARREVLQRLLKLNHERYAEEVKQGLHGKKKTATKKASKPTKKSTPKTKKSSNPPEFQQPSLFDQGEGE